MHAIAAALSRLPARSVWKVTEAELASAGAVGSLNLSSNVKVGCIKEPTTTISAKPAC